MANTVDDACKEITGVVRAVTGIKAALDYPAGAPPVFPFSVCYPKTGSLQIGPPDTMKGLHTLTLSVYFSISGGLAETVKDLNPFVDSIGNALFKALKNGTFTNIQTFVGEEIPYSVNPKQYGGIDAMCIEFNPTVKLMATIS